MEDELIDGAEYRMGDIVVTAEKENGKFWLYQYDSEGGVIQRYSILEWESWGKQIVKLVPGQNNSFTLTPTWKTVRDLILINSK